MRLQRISLVASLVGLMVGGVVTVAAATPAVQTTPQLVARSCDALNDVRRASLLDIQKQMEKQWESNLVMPALPGGVPVTAPPVSPEPASLEQSEEASSETNVNVAGTDEGDVVENDGRYVYASFDGELRVLDGVSGRQVASLGNAEGGAELLLFDSRLLVVRPDLRGGSDLSVFDVSKPTKPRLVSQVTVAGMIRATRSRGGLVNVVVDHYFELPQLGYPAENTAEGRRIQAEKNRKLIAASRIEDQLPRLSSGEVLPCERLFLVATALSQQVSWVAQVNLRSESTSKFSIGIGVEIDNQHVVQSENAIVLAGYVHLVVIDVAGSSLSYGGLLELEGRLPSQFSISEHEGYLRVATITFNNATRNVISVFRLRGGVQRVAQLTGLGEPGEQIKGVRFVGPMAYVITFETTDPLYVVDLKDPTKPKLLGELKIPGFSAYLQFIGNNQVIGVGEDENFQGEASLFDVSKPSKPKRLGTAKLGQGSFAAVDHQAFLWWQPTKTLVLPFDPGPDADYEPQRRPVMVLSGAGGKLTRRGRVTHQYRKGQYNQENAEVQYSIYRSMIVNGQLITISRLAIKSTNVNTLKPNWYLDEF